MRNRFVFFICASWGMEIVIIAAFPFFWMGDVRYFGCTKDYSSVLEPPGGLGGV